MNNIYIYIYICVCVCVFDMAQSLKRHVYVDIVAHI